MSGSFWVFRCTGCGQWAVREIRTELKGKSFKCFHCRKSTTIKPETRIGLGLMHKGPYQNPRQATEVCQALNNLRGQEK